MPEAAFTWKAGVIGTALAGGLLFPLAMIRWRVPVAARRIYRQQRGLRQEVTLAWTREELAIQTALGQARLPWADYIRWREDRNIVLLFQSDAIFQMLPKRVLSPAALGELRACAEAAGVPGAARPRG